MRWRFNWFAACWMSGADPVLSGAARAMGMEDIGLYDPRAMQMCNDAAATMNAQPLRANLAPAQAASTQPSACEQRWLHGFNNKAKAFVKGVTHHQACAAASAMLLPASG